MKIIKVVIVLALPLFTASAFAQTVDTEVTRNVNQQERIEKGLESGALNTKEAASLERKEAHIDHMEAHALKDGTVTTQEADRIKTAQNKTSAAIYNQKHDAQKGNPDSVSSMRMQEDVQRNINQQNRIEKGVSSGALTNQEAAKLERGQARESRREARAGADGHVSTAEQNKIQRTEDRQSRRIHHEKHDKQTKS